MTLEFDVIEDPRACATLTPLECNQLFIGGTTPESAAVIIDLDTGEVTLNKPISEASQLFWDAVSALFFSQKGNLLRCVQ